MSFTADLKKIAKARKQSMTQVTKSILFDVSNQPILMSPVDEGTFRANWLAAIGSADYSYDKGKTNITESQGRLTATLFRFTSDADFYFTNSMPYAQKLEDGYSEFAPSGMVRVTINDFPSIVEQRVSESR